MPRKKSTYSKRKSAKKSVHSLDINPEKYFVLCNGQTIKDYRELADILESIGDDIFHYHVNDERNDFATWIYDVFKEENLANSLREVKSKIEMLKVLYQHLYKKSEKPAK